MKLSIFTTCSNPIERQDPFYEAISCYKDLADEVIIINGKIGDEYNLETELVQMNDKVKVVRYEWPEEFSWEFIGQQFQRGYEACTGDWIIHADLDFFFHENDFDKIRKTLEENSEEPAVSFWKYQFLLVDRYRLKSRLVITVNKGKYKNRIKFNSGGDLCQPSLDGMELKPDTVKEIGVPFYNYDFCFKEKNVIAKEFYRMAKARNKVFPNDNWGIESKEKALEYFKKMQLGRFENNLNDYKKIKLEDHPRYIQDRIYNIKPNQFGFNMFSWIKEKSYE